MLRFVRWLDWFRVGSPTAAAHGEVRALHDIQTDDDVVSDVPLLTSLGRCRGTRLPSELRPVLSGAMVVLALAAVLL